MHASAAPYCACTALSTVFEGGPRVRAEQWRSGREASAKPVKVVASASELLPESVLQKHLTDARSSVKKLTLQVQELTDANTTLAKQLAAAAAKETLTASISQSQSSSYQVTTTRASEYSTQLSKQERSRRVV